MATAMHKESEVTIHNVHRVYGVDPSVSEERFRNLIIYSADRDDDEKTREGVDDNLVRYGDVWHEEFIRLAKKKKKDEWCFAVAVAAGAEWASKLLPFVPALYPKTRKMLAKVVVDGWLGCKKPSEEYLFGQTLRNWPDQEGKLVGDAIREILEFRSNDNPTQKVARLFVQSGKVCNNNVAVVMLRAVLKWLNQGQLEQLGDLFFLLVDREHSENCEERRRVIGDTVHKLLDSK